METVKLGYSAFSNVLYNYEYDTGLTREEWDELSEEEQNDIFVQGLFQDVDGWVKV